ncbi:3-dehydroquinate synthase [Propionibacterium sp.]|uniref:3-dehydroquinate synthase n=1 Tax=Propionibacterium sp. TaxID=1977903 RepID=UPI0039EAD963
MSTAHFATDHPYDAIIEPGALERLPEFVGGAAKVAILHPQVLSGKAQLAADLVRGAGAEPVLIEVPDGEHAKTSQVLAECWSRLALAGLTRTDLVVGIGGGATTDLAGFVAATWLRGVRWISVPTTVLAMVDAAIGGKTGADLPEGKNLIGAFWEPIVVLEDPLLLVGLPEREVRSGLAEVIKHGFIADERTLELVEQNPAEALDVSGERVHELIARSVAVKAKVVSADLREATSVGEHIGREQLNYGHTLGHAIEASEHFARRHGECVALGMVFVAELAHRALGLDASVVERHRRVLGSVGLATQYPDSQSGGTGWATLRELMSRDKKTRGNTLRFVGLREQGHVAMIVDPPEQQMVDAFRALVGQHS